MTGRKIFPTKYAGFEILVFFCSLGLGINPLQFSLDFQPVKNILQILFWTKDINSYFQT
jgi:hypothetical protein